MAHPIHMANTGPKKLNLIKSPTDSRDFTIHVVLQYTRVDEIVDNSRYCTEIKDQGEIGSCTAFASVALLEYNKKKFDGNSKNSEEEFSEKFTYYVTRVEMMKYDSNEDTGAYLKDSIASLVQYGTCYESSCPYNSIFIDKPSTNAYTQALNNQVVSYAKILEGNTHTEKLKSLNECKQMISNGYGLVAGFVCFTNIWSSVGGVIPLPSGTVIGGHAIFLCGYDEVNQRFKFKNSWSRSWGDQGYGYLPYEYLLQGYMWDIWTVFQQEYNNVNIGVRQPLATEKLNVLQSRVDIYVKDTLASNIQAKLNNQAVRNSISSINSSILTLLRNSSIPRGATQHQVRTALTSIISQHNTLAGLVNKTEVTIRQSDTALKLLTQ